MTLDGATGPRASRGRRTSRPTGDDREQAILATAVRLLERHALSEISIDDLARGAGISRPTFYFYFRSKDAVLLTLLDRVNEEAVRALADPLDRVAEDPVRCWRECLAALYTTFHSHRPVLLATAEVRHTNAEVARWCADMMDVWVTRTEQAIEAERARGAAPPGPGSRELAIVLNAMVDRALYATFTGDGPAVPAAEVVDVLLHAWLTSIYQTAEPAPA
ncbi:TetR/AcrR family transcriptional regulator [Nonomuraea deserti]|uniref:TetR/AcrR family transcriptional regulator n=1 Tax=Nonomuraea deserti TaxID=1848322 RepID=A0A4R4V4D9_9ACTN|nr:TetR/AcrR family transcriptional regulator [Nonomuraea deserti]TDD00029.1 TetR/AcrR family transcriptional regulator [Nonomuraea deserti]